MKKFKAFTLIELLVVIAIIALLLSILAPSLGKVKKQAQNLICKTNMHNYQIATVMYLNENAEMFPYAWTSLYSEFQYPSEPGNLRYCRWHNQDFNLETYPEYAGPMWGYLSAKDVHVCPTFKGFSTTFGSEHSDHDENIAIQKDALNFSYSQNALLGWKDDPENLAVMKRTQVNSPSTVFLYGEENMWTTSGRNGWVLNDNALLVKYWNGGSGFDDSLGTFHRAPSGKSKSDLNKGVSNVVFVDGSTGEATGDPDKDVRMSRPK